MCDLSMFNGLLTGAETSIIVALGCLATAMVLNGGFFSAPGSPVPLGFAAAASAAAFVLIGTAMASLDEYASCKGSLGSCLGSYDSLKNSLLFLSTTLAIQAAAFVAALLMSVIPFVGVAPMSVIAFTLASLLVSISTTLFLYEQFMKCMSEQPSSWVIGLGIIVILITAGILISAGPAILKAIRAFKGPKWW